MPSYTRRCSVESFQLVPALMVHEDSIPDDQIATGAVAEGLSPCSGRPASVFLGSKPQGLHTTPTVRHPRPQGLLQNRLSGRRPTFQGLRRTPAGLEAHQD